MRGRLIQVQPTHISTGPDIHIHLDEEEQDGERDVLSTPTHAFPCDRHPGRFVEADSAQRPAVSAPRSAHDQTRSGSTLSKACDRILNAMYRTAAASGPVHKSPQRLPPAPPAPTKNASAAIKTTRQPSSPATAAGLSRMNSTIRAVTSFEDRGVSDDEDEANEGGSTSRTSAFSSSLNSDSSAMSSLSIQHQRRPVNGADRNESGARRKLTKGSRTNSTSVPGPPLLLEMAGPRAGLEGGTWAGRSSMEIPTRISSLTAPVGIPSLSADKSLSNDGFMAAVAAHMAESGDGASGGWDSTIGKAGLGKTGRVVNKLMSDNDALKREIKVEKLRAEEAKRAARLLEDKMDKMQSDYESRLLEASVTKTLLARKERQVESLMTAIELERKRAREAGERESSWKEELDKATADAKRRVEEAGNHAALMGGRYNAISSHWRDQGEETKRALGKMRLEIEKLREERKRDDDKITTLRDLCDQQDANIRDLRQKKEGISTAFERYKAEQEAALRIIKDKATQREQEQEKMLAETRQVLDKLKWALNVKETMAWAQ